MRKFFILAAVSGAGFVLSALPAYANDVSAISDNMTDSAELLPGLISAAAYLLGILFGVQGILRIKKHVENPQQMPLTDALPRLVAGGALFSLPLVYRAMKVTIDGGVGDPNFDDSIFTVMGFLSAIGAAATLLPLQDINQILGNIVDSVEDVPGLLTAACYLLGLILGVTGILKLKEHVENPQQTGLKEGVVRIIIGGALFSVGTVHEVMFMTMQGQGGLLDYLFTIISAIGLFFSFDATAVGCPTFAINSIGGVMCNIMIHTIAIPAFLGSMSYLFGIFIGVWGIMKLKDHALNPQQVSVWEGVARLVVAGLLFALPSVMAAVYNTVAALMLPHTTTRFNWTAAAGPGLDTMLVLLMQNILAPATVLFNWFGFVSGMVLIIVGIMRLLKSAQEGVRGPGGIGTLMTFLVGGALISLNPMIAAFSSSLTSVPLVTFTYATMSYDPGLTPDQILRVHSVITAIIAFMIVVGWISFIRGWFIVREYAEGSQQASLMSAITHLIGGAMCINLGPMLNAVQATLGITAYGVSFTI